MGKIKCCNCNEVFVKKIPINGGTFPIYRICPKCNVRNYIFDLDNGTVNNGTSFDESSNKTAFGFKIIL